MLAISNYEAEVRTLQYRRGNLTYKELNRCKKLKPIHPNRPYRKANAALRKRPNLAEISNDLRLFKE